MPADGGIRFGQYVLLRRIARGGMAEVFLAQQRGFEGFDRRVAVKRILPHLVDSPDFVKMFLGEAKLAAQLTHPNIVHIYDFGKVDNDYFIAMEYVDGVHAGQVFKQSGTDRMSPTMIARIGADAAAALHHAHELRAATGTPYGIVHRDVSPANLMVSYDGVVKLCDFGIAKAAVLGDPLTNPGQVKGKYTYMSPEQTVAAPLDGRSDVFSLAIVLWELLAGKSMVARGDPYAAMRAIRDGKLEPIAAAAPGTPAELAKAIGWALEARREQRATAAELSAALEAFIKASPELATPMHVAAWVRDRFPRAATGLTGPRAALPDDRTGPGPGTVAAPHTPVAPTTIVAQTGPPVVPVTSAPVEPPPESKPQATEAPATQAAAAASGEPGEPHAVVGDHDGDDDGETILIEDRRQLLARRSTVRPEDAVIAPGAPGRPDRGRGSGPLDDEETIVAPSAHRPFAPIPSVAPLPVAPRSTARRRPRPRRRRTIAFAALGGIAVVGVVVVLATRSTTAPAPAGAVTAAAPAVDAAAAARAGDRAPADGPPTRRPDAAPLPSLYKVDTNPRGAVIAIGDQKRTAPARFALPPGRYRVLAELEGWHPERREIEIFAGVDLVQEIPFSKRMIAPARPHRGTLTVRTTPYSEVYIGNRKIGEAPFADLELEPGSYTLVFKHPKHPVVRKTVTIVAGKLTKLPAFRLPEP